jgi:hypothetical protein
MDTFLGRPTNALKNLKKIIYPLLLGAFVLSGCASQYVIRLNNGMDITAASKPKLDGAVYRFKDAKGEERVVSRGRVIEIEPASLARAEKKPKSVPTGSTPHKRHWYFLWLF